LNTFKSLRPINQVFSCIWWTALLQDLAGVRQIIAAYLVNSI